MDTLFNGQYKLTQVIIGRAGLGVEARIVAKIRHRFFEASIGEILRMEEQPTGARQCCYQTHNEIANPVKKSS